MMQILLLMLVWFIAPLSSQAQAQGTAPAASPEYQKLIDDGIQEFQRRNFAEARSLFGRANAIHPNARTLRGLGMTELELGNYVDSADFLRSALGSKTRPLMGTLRSETEAVLARAEGFIAHVKIATAPVPPTTVLVDGVEARLRDGNELLLTVGDHALELQASGYQPWRLQKKVQGGERETLEHFFEKQEAPAPVVAAAAPVLPASAPLPATAPLPAVALPAEPAPSISLTPASQPARDTDTRRPLYKNPWLWTGVGVLAAGAATGLALGLRKDARIEAPIAENPVAIQKGP